MLDTDLWSFNGHLFIPHLLQPGENSISVPLFHVSFWVQVYELPAGFMSLGVGSNWETILAYTWNMMIPTTQGYGELI